MDASRGGNNNNKMPRADKYSKVEQSRERKSALPYSVVAIEKGAFWSSLTKGRQLYLLTTSLCFTDSFKSHQNNSMFCE